MRLCIENSETFSLRFISSSSLSSSFREWPIHFLLITSWVSFPQNLILIHFTDGEHSNKHSVSATYTLKISWLAKQYYLLKKDPAPCSQFAGYFVWVNKLYSTSQHYFDIFKKKIIFWSTATWEPKKCLIYWLIVYLIMLSVVQNVWQWDKCQHGTS